MTNTGFLSTNYDNHDRQVAWCGICMANGNEYHRFIKDDVVARLYDEEGTHEFETCVHGLAPTGFAQESLNEVLAAGIPEERSWAIGEALAEAYLQTNHDILWPWNMERDKRTSKASLPGADLVGFEIKNSITRLALGEVKTSSDNNTPPNVMNGRSGMSHQIDNLANNLGLVNQLLKWLFFRCNNTVHEGSYKAAVKLFLQSGNKAISLFGILIRDTQPNEMDLKNRGQSLANIIQDPTTCKLFAIYLPCNIEDLPTLVTEDE